MKIDLSDCLKTEALDPKWEKAGKIHDWRNHISDNVRMLWPTFTDEQKFALTEQADSKASDEKWE
jgi:hypothetical protein